MLWLDISSIAPLWRIDQAWQTLPMLPHTSHEALAAWVRLSTEPGLGPIKIHRLLSLFDSPQDLYCASSDALHARLPAALALKLSQAPDLARLRQIDATLAWLADEAHHLLTVTHPLYPTLLKEIPDHPVLLYAQGDLQRLQHAGIAIVGARNATADGRDHAKAFARHLSEQGWCVISGLAHGIDAAAHAGALCTSPNAGGTIAVLGTGIDIIYPAAHRVLSEKIVSQQGLILSEFSLGTPPLAGHFPRRNRIVAGLARGVLVVEAACKSGSLITARLAAEMGREVFAIPGSIHSPLSKGPHALIQQGAKLVANAEDILSELSHVSFAAVPDHTIPARLTGEAAHPQIETSAMAHRSREWAQSPLWAEIGYNPVSEETLAQRSGLAPMHIQAELLTLELSGAITRTSNGRVSRVHQQGVT